MSGNVWFKPMLPDITSGLMIQWLAGLMVLWFMGPRPWFKPEVPRHGFMVEWFTGFMV